MLAAKNTVKLIDILKSELELLEEYNRGCESLHKNVVAKNWTTLESVLNTLRNKADMLNTLDQKRESFILQLKEDCGLSPQASFGLLMTHLDTHAQKEIKMMKQKIRLAVCVLQTRINGIGSYTESQTSALRDVLDELIPEQRGRIYNSSGTASRVENKPLLFNHQF
jgi:hypothetical protein